MGLPKNNEEDSRREKLDEAADLASEGREDEAYCIYADLLNKNFDDAHAIYGIARINMQAERYGEAYNFYRLAAGFKQLGTAPYNGMVLCHAETWDLDAAMSLCKRALALDPKDKHALGNMSLIYLLKCEPETALKYGEMALKQDIEHDAVFHHMTYAKLMLGQWKEGWEGHQHILGKVKTRTERFYENHGKMLPRWDGTPGQRVLVYGEQGIGDEISFASCIPDLARVSDLVALDCDHRLVSLFRQSFDALHIHAYGTRFKNPLEWIDSYELDARVAIGDLPRFFRNKDSDFPGTPYLTAIPRPLYSPLESRRPQIGIAWSGGLKNTGLVKRSLTLEALLPIFKSVDATWVSLEYTDKTEEIDKFKVEHGVWIETPEAARSKDYSETASLVAGLDLVISVTTAVVHLSGALGKECWTLVPSRPRWWYGLKGETTPWYKSVSFFRQPKDKGWEEPITKISNLLQLRYG